jgi:hypothetical protein
MTSEKKYCYRYEARNDSQGRAIVSLEKRVIIRETEKSFWHVWDNVWEPLDSLILRMESLTKERKKAVIKRCSKGADRSRFHYTKEEALRAFVYRKMYQLERMKLTMETAKICLAGLRGEGIIGEGYRCAVNRIPDGDEFLAATNPGPVAQEYTWGEY